MALAALDEQTKPLWYSACSTLGPMRPFLIFRNGAPTVSLGQLLLDARLPAWFLVDAPGYLWLVRWST